MGYLLCQYLSLFTNKIESGFGGNFQERTAFPLAVLGEVKKRVPQRFPVGFRIILREWVPQGIDLAEALSFARVLEKNGIAYLSASAGTYNSIFSPAALKIMTKTAYLKKDMARLTKRVSIPTITSGRIITLSMADELVRGGVADLIGLGRSLRADPLWVAKALEKKGNIKTCLNCNWCLKRVVLEQGFNCIRWPEVLRERTTLEHQLMTRNYKPLWVITDTRDIQTFKHSLPLLIQGKGARFLPAVLILKPVQPDRQFDPAQQKFIEWMKKNFDPFTSTGETVHWVVREHSGNPEKIVQDEIALKNYGRIFISSNRTDPWRDRLLYEQRGKVMVRLCANNRQDKVMVPVDLSSATLLVMIFLGKTLMKEQGVCIHFVHVLTGKLGPVERQWEKMKKITAFKQNTPLVFPPARNNRGPRRWWRQW